MCMNDLFQLCAIAIQEQQKKDSEIFGKFLDVGVGCNHQVK